MIRWDTSIFFPLCALRVFSLCVDLIDPRFEWPVAAVEGEGAAERDGQRDCSGEAFALAMVFEFDVALRMRECRFEVIQRTEMWSDANGCKAGRGGFDASDESEQVVVGMRGPRVGVRAGLAGVSGQVLKCMGRSLRQGSRDFRYSSAIVAWSIARAR